MNKILLLLLLVSHTGYATVFADRSFQESVLDAPGIARGITGTASVDWRTLSDGSRRLFTLTSVTLTEVFRGQFPDKTILVRELGGEKDGIGMAIAGTAKFAPGEDVILLLGTKNSDGSFPLRAMMMSKFSVIRSDLGKEVLSGPGLKKSEHEQQSEGHDGDTTNWTIDDFRNLVTTQDTRDRRNTPGNEDTSIPSRKPPLQTQENTQSLPTSKPEMDRAVSIESLAENRFRLPIIAIFAIISAILIIIFTRLKK